MKHLKVSHAYKDETHQCELQSSGHTVESKLYPSLQEVLMRFYSLIPTLSCAEEFCEYKKNTHSIHCNMHVDIIYMFC